MLGAVLAISLSLIGGSGASKHIVATGYTAGEPKKIVLYPIVNNGYLRSDAAQAFLLMHAAAAKDGIELKVNSSFRTYKEQKRQIRLRPRLAAKPGYSNHQRGTAVDIAFTRVKIDGVYHKTIIYWWLKRNAHKYGFHQTIDFEPWHWDYQNPNIEQI